MALLDPAQLDAMASGRPELLLPIINDFLAHGRNQLVNLHTALTEDRLQDGKEILHQLKGSSGTMGMIQLADLCRECEGQVATGQLPPRLDELEPVLKESVEQAEIYLASKYR